MEEKNTRNLSQDIAIAEIQKDVFYLRKEVADIKAQVFNHLPGKIEELNQSFQKYKLSSTRWLVEILVSLLFIFIGVILNLIIK